MIKGKTVKKFLDEVSSKNPTPGGGSVSAVAGAMAASLVGMVANLTIGKKGYEKVSAKMTRIKNEARRIELELLSLADADALAFEKVMKAFGLAKETKNRGEKIEKAFKGAAEVPLKTASLSAQIIDFARVLQKEGNKNTISDSKVALHLAKAAKAGALENVKINLEFIKDEVWKKKIKKEIAKIN